MTSTSETDSPVYDALTIRPADTPPFADSAIDQRISDVRAGLDRIADVITILQIRLQPVLAHEPDVEGDDQTEPPATGTSPVTLRLHQLQLDTGYLADKLAAITAAVEL